MAYTVSHLASGVFGDARYKSIRLTADAATGASIDVGLGVIEGISVSVRSAATGGTKFKINEGVSSTANVGFLSVTGAASGDVWDVIVYGV